MTEITSLLEAETALARYIPAAGSQKLKYSLDRMLELMHSLGDPQNSLKVIHVAGTSGKTSTSYYIAAMLQAAGKKVGLTISPYIESVNERVQINLEPVPADKFASQLNEFLPLVDKTKLNPTYFEVLIAYAYWTFAKEGVDYAVVEVGLGGRLDGTNVIARQDKLCVITDIGLDHTEILGDTIAEIAAQKAGIITPGNEVYMYEQSYDVMSAVMAACKANDAQLHIVQPGARKLPNSMPDFQKRNWGLAHAAAVHIFARDNITPPMPELMHRTMQLQVPARMEKFHLPKQTIILDGAHNPQKLAAFLGSLQAVYPGQKLTILVALLSAPKHKLQSSLSELLPYAAELIITEFSAGQDIPRKSYKAHEVAQACDELGFNNYLIIEDPMAALQELAGRQTDPLIVTGSLYLVSQLRPAVLQLSHAKR